MNTRKTRIIMALILTVSMAFSLTPASAGATLSGSDKTGGSAGTSGAAEYRLCTVEKNNDTGEKELTPPDEETGYIGYIGQTKEIILAQKTADGDSAVKWEEVDASKCEVSWNVSQKTECIRDITASGTAKTRRSYSLLKENDDTVTITATVTIGEEQPVECSFTMNVYDGYNPGFDPDDEDEVIALIKDAENSGKVIELETGTEETGKISENDGCIVFRFRTEKSRFFDFTSVNSSAPCCAYLYSFDSEPPEEMERSETCEIICADENGNDNFSITGSDYKNPLEENFDSTAYYLIVKYYRSSSLGEITASCSMSSSEVMYDPYMYYTVGDSGTQKEVETYEGFTYSDKEKMYLAHDIIPYNYDSGSDIYLKYLDSRESSKIRTGLKEGRNMIIETGENMYAIDLTFEKESDILFEAYIYTEDGDEYWSGDTVCADDFDSEGNVSMDLPRNSSGKEFILQVESVCSSRVYQRVTEADSIIEIPFTAAESGNSIKFNVSTADATDHRSFTVSTSENHELGIDEMSMEYSGVSSDDGSNLEASDRILWDEFNEEGVATVYVPAWFGTAAERKFDSDICLTDEGESTDYSVANVMDVVSEVAESGRNCQYTFNVYDKKNREKYNREYAIIFRLSDPGNADLRYARMSWIDSNDDETKVEELQFISGKGTEASPKTATVRMPEGMTITNDYFETSVVAIAKECATLYTCEDEYEAQGCEMNYALLGESKSEKVKFKSVSQDGKNTVYYVVNVYDHDKAFSKGTVFSDETGTYKVTGTGKSPEVSMVAAPSGDASVSGETGNTSVNIGAAITSGPVKYSITAVGRYAFRNSAASDVTVGPNVRKIGYSAFAGAKKVKVLKVKTPRLTKAGVKNSLKGSSVTTIKCTGKAANSKTRAKYRKYFTRANCGKTVKVR